MISQVRTSTFLAFLIVTGAVAASASSAQSKLLALVPEGAQFVAGIEDPHTPPADGWLLLLTRKTSLDLQDWIALSSVDPHRRADEIIEVATSTAGGAFSEHLVLLAGQFDRELIFRAALRNGASVTEDRGQRVLVVKPFTREKEGMTASRWTVIIDDRMAIFGSPELVRQTLERYRNRLGPDPMLVEHLRELHSDVNSWNVLVMSAPMLSRNVASAQLHDPWTHILDGADELTFGIHYGSTDRIDFAVHAVSSQKALYLAGFLAQPRLVPVDLSTSMRPRLQNLLIEQNRVCGSFLVPANQFERWIASEYTSRSSAPNFQSRP